MYNANIIKDIEEGKDLRIIIFVLVITIMAFFVVARLFILMILDHDAYSVLAANSQEMFSELLPTRGEVYIQDSRTKEEYPLAINRDFFLVFFDTTQIKDDVTAESAAGKLAEVFNYDDEKKLSVYLQLNKRDDPYEPIANKVDEETMDKLKELNLPGIGFERKYERFYPEGSLASQVIGFLGKTDDGGNIGRYGVEGYWQKELAGSGGFPLLINLALKQFEATQELVGAFLQYNDNTVERGLFYQALNVVLVVLLDGDLELEDYVVNFRRMFGNPRMDAVLGSVDGSVRFFGLTPTSMKLEGLDRHQRLIDSYKKLHMARANVAATSS